MFKKSNLGLFIFLSLLTISCSTSKEAINTSSIEVDKDTETQQAPNEPDEDGVYTKIEQMPSLIGGLMGLQQRVNYPLSAVRSKQSGRVTIQFIVTEQGVPTELKVLKGVASSLDKEALKVVRESRFTPGIKDGKAVKVKMSLPVVFVI